MWFFKNFVLPPDKAILGGNMEVVIPKDHSRRMRKIHQGANPTGKWTHLAVENKALSCPSNQISISKGLSQGNISPH